MPLLNRKRVPLSPVIPYDPKRKRKEVWYLRFTNEVFTSYEAYINKLTLYNQTIWECEATGRQNLTYEQALESEKTEYDRLEYKFCPALRKLILKKVQNQTIRLEDLVQNIFDYLSNMFVINEIIQCKLNDYEYFAQIISIVGQSAPGSDTEEEQVPRQPNGRLRFPEAFLHPLPKSHNEESQQQQYEVQLIDDDRNPLENCTRIVNHNQIYRDKLLFNRLNLQKFIRECCYKDSFINAPWLIRESIAMSNGLDSSKSTPKKRKLVQNKSTNEKETEKRTRKEETLLLKAKLKEEKERKREERKKQAAIKYPLEDLDLPIYRKDPDGNWHVTDLAPHKHSHHQIPFPKAGKPDRPTPHHETRIPAELFDSFLSIWTFMTVFAEPLKLTGFSVDEFEQALFHTTHQPKATVLVEYHACLLNVIIKERDDDTPNETINGDSMENYVDSLDKEDRRVERGWRDKECLRISQKWDHKELRANYDRRGWETALIGCLNEVATPTLLPNVDDILQHMVPKVPSTAIEREKQYPTLSIQHKLNVLQFLIDVVNESVLIKNYMEYCQEQLTEFRKQKSELKKELKALTSKRIQLGRRERLSRSQEASDDDEDDSEDSQDSDNSNTDSDLESDSSDNRIHSRQKKQEDLERSHVQGKNKHHTNVNERRKLEEEEKVLKGREKQLEKSMRRYMTLRVRPIGKDRFNNRYIYLDNIGVSNNTYGSGRLYILNPSDGDIRLMMERDDRSDLPDVPWGYGGGRWFIRQLMEEQGLVEEKNWLENRMNELSSEKETEYRGWWKYYSEPEELEQLMEWLNPKGIRELKLKNELTKLQPFIVESMQKRAQAKLQELDEPKSVTKRTRAKTAANSLDTWSKKL